MQSHDIPNLRLVSYHNMETTLMNTERRRWEKAIYRDECRGSVGGGGGAYLSELVGHEEGRSVGFGLHVRHVGGGRGVDVVARKNLRAEESGFTFTPVSMVAAMQML